MKVPRSGRPHHIGVYYGAKAADCRAVWRRALITGGLTFWRKADFGFYPTVPQQYQGGSLPRPRIPS